MTTHTTNPQQHPPTQPQPQSVTEPALPAADPPASPSPVTSPVATQLPTSSTAPNVTPDVTPETPTDLTAPAASATPAVRRVGARALTALRRDLTLRDWDILRLVADHRYLTTRQLEGFCFTSLGSPASAERTARRVLARLAIRGVLRTLDRRIGGVRSGSSGTVYYLAPAGARLLDDADGRRYRSREPSGRFLEHCLAVADVHLELVGLSTRDQLDGVEVVTEPACWRSWTGPAGQTRSLEPDLFALITGSDYEDSWFIEVDMGTESIPAILKKAAIYDAYRRTGVEQAAHDVFPRVCWLMKGPKDQARATALRHHLAAQAYPDGLFQVTTEDQFTLTLTGDLT